MNVPVRRPLFNRRPETNLYRMFFWIVLILGGVCIYHAYFTGIGDIF